jgi:molybdopterin-binding protein
VLRKKKMISEIIKGSILNPRWKGYCLIESEGKNSGRIIIDSITKKQAKELQLEIEKRGMPF